MADCFAPITAVRMLAGERVKPDPERRFRTTQGYLTDHNSPWRSGRQKYPLTLFLGIGDDEPRVSDEGFLHVALSGLELGVRHPFAAIIQPVDTERLGAAVGEGNRGRDSAAHGSKM